MAFLGGYFGRQEKEPFRVEKVKGIKDLARGITGTAPAVVYEAPRSPLAVQIGEYAAMLRFHLDVYFGELKKYNGKDKGPILQQRDRVIRRLQQDIPSSDGKKLIAEIVTFLYDDVITILDAFPEYRITDMYAKGGYDESVSAKNRVWHTDADDEKKKDPKEESKRIQDNQNAIHIVRTFNGPSTEYAEDEHGTSKVVPAPGSITAHRSDTYHRGPDNTPGRFAIAIRLERIPKEKR